MPHQQKRIYHTHYEWLSLIYQAADGFDDAIIGLCGERVVYDERRCIEILAEDMGSVEEALDYFGYNVEGSYVGEHTPLYVEVV